MKKKMIYIFICVFVILLSSIIISSWKYLLFSPDNYKIYNEKGESLPILLFSRTINHEFGNPDSPNIEEIILYIEDGVNMNDATYNNDVLSIHTKIPDILYPNGGRNIYTKLGRRILFQHSSYMTDEFRSLYNNGFNYEQKEDEPIKFFIAQGNKFKFNTYAGLKVYGDTIIVEKLDGIVEKEFIYSAFSR